MLHTLMCSPFQCDFSLLLRMLRAGDDLLLMQDGVVTALTGSRTLPALLNSPASLWVLQEDVLARGLDGKVSPEITTVDYSGFVALTEKQRQQMSW